jgi:hypothetical protein
LSGFSSYATTAAANTTISGISIAENCAAANINNAIRQLMADARAFADSAASTAGLMPLSGGAFTGQITRSGSGGYLYNAASAQAGGAVYVLPQGTALPSSPQEGTFVFFY